MTFRLDGSAAYSSKVSRFRIQQDTFESFCFPFFFSVLAPDTSVTTRVAGFIDYRPYAFISQWIDNSVSSPHIKNLMIGPCFDNEGKLRGVVQLYNKNGVDPISSKEKKELEALPDQIEALETEQAQLHEKIADPIFYQDAGDEVAKVNQRLQELETELETIYERWSELDAITSGES